MYSNERIWNITKVDNFFNNLNHDLYVVIDGAKVQDPEVFASGYGFHIQCLFTGDAYLNMHSVAPYLAYISKDNKKGLNYIKKDLIENQACIMFHSLMEFDKAFSHLRKFTRVQDEKGKWFYFRYYEPKFTKTWLKEDGESFFRDLIKEAYVPIEENIHILNYQGE